MLTDTQTHQIQDTYMLNDLIGTKVTLHGKKIGIVVDLIAKENGTLPYVTHIFIKRSFGDPALLIPWEFIRSVTLEEIVVSITDIKKYENIPVPEMIKLKDHILDKKVLDMEDREIEVVYDIKLIGVNGKLFVSDVEISAIALFRRVGLSWLVNYLNSKSSKDKFISWKYIQSIAAPLGRFRGDLRLNILKEKLSDIHPVDLAGIFEELDNKQRISIFDELDSKHASVALEEASPKTQREIISSLKKEKLSQLLNHMTTGQIADLLSVLPFNDVRIILHLLDARNVRKVKAILDKQEEDIVNYSTTKYIKVASTDIVDEVRDNYKNLAKDKKIVMYLYVIDDKEKLLGVIDIRELLEAREDKTMKDIATDEIIYLTSGSSLKTALNMFEKYDFRAMPIIDKGQKIIGVVSYRDIRDLKHRMLE